MVYLTVVCLVDDPTGRDELHHMMAELSILLFVWWLLDDKGDRRHSQYVWGYCHRVTGGSCVVVVHVVPTRFQQLTVLEPGMEGQQLD